MEREEALSYPVAFWGFALSFAFMIGWSMLAGVRADIAIALWGAYIVFAIGCRALPLREACCFCCTTRHHWVSSRACWAPSAAVG
jgi:hypothetical protein